jgi:putative methyltransferase (TIGR04325 family)
MLKQAIKQLLPPVALTTCRHFRWGRQGYFRDYASWADALSASDGYETETILRRTVEAARKVKRGEAACDRDGVAFAESQIPWPVATGLLRIAVKTGGRLRVLDFGGGLGSTYHACRCALDEIYDLRWAVVEQPAMVAIGKTEIATAELTFHESLDAAMAEGNPDVILFSSVLPYLSNPYEVLSRAVTIGAKSMIITRTVLLPEGNIDRLTVQHVHPSIYRASYPAWILARSNLLSSIQPAYRVALEFKTSMGPIKLHRPTATAYEQGFFLDRI